MPATRCVWRWGFCLYGNDIDDTTSPIEAGLNWLTKFVDGKEFIDRKLMEEQKAGGLTRKLVGFKMIDRGIPRMVTRSPLLRAISSAR